MTENSKRNLSQGEQLAVIAAIVERIEENQKHVKSAQEAIVRDLHDLHSKTDDLQRRMASVEPVTQLVTSWRARMIGAGMVLGFFGTVAGFGYVLLKERAADVWRAIWGA